MKLLIYFYADDVTVTDHIPVDDNPVYITMKRIHMNKNSAYEMVHLGVAHALIQATS